MRVLKLTVRKKRFDMIKSGEKKEEYLEIKPYWIKRLHHAPETPCPYYAVEFIDGYNTEAPRCKFHLDSISIGKANPEWIGSNYNGNDVFILKLGDMIELLNKHENNK